MAAAGRALNAGKINHRIALNSPVFLVSLFIRPKGTVSSSRPTFGRRRAPPPSRRPSA